MSRHQ